VLNIITFKIDMSQTNLYYPTQLETKVSLLPEQIDGDMDAHLLENLRSKVEGKCMENGIVLRVNKIIDYDYGMIDKANFMGTTVYNIKYECFICSPTKELEIICVLENIVKGYLIGRNGPIVIAVQFNNIDTRKFKIADNNIYNIKTDTPLKKGDHIRVSIINVNNNLGEKNIITVCKLIGMAGKEDVRKFNDEQALMTDELETDNREFI
jgi:DNA-directed RNA polymerase subunit E'/Rpb7